VKGFCAITLCALGLGYLCLAAACSPPSTGEPPTADWQGTVDAFVSLGRGQAIPEHLLQEDAARTGEEFDPNGYFPILDHLSMEPGYVLDYVYWYDFMGGFPVLYARPEEQPRYGTLSEYQDAVGDLSPEAFRHGFLDHVRTDGTAEGFFQFVVLRVMGRQFYLYWHANYDDATVICSRARLEELLGGIGELGQEMPAEDREKARALDVAPVVELQDDTVLVQVVIFTKWGGFFRQSYTIGREFPHQVLHWEEEELVPYDCGIQF